MKNTNTTTFSGIDKHVSEILAQMCVCSKQQADLCLELVSALQQSQRDEKPATPKTTKATKKSPAKKASSTKKSDDKKADGKAKTSASKNTPKTSSNNKSRAKKSDGKVVKTWIMERDENGKVIGGHLEIKKA